MFYLRFAAALLGFLAASFYGVAIAVFRRDRSRVATDYAQLLTRWVGRPLGIRVHVEGRERLYAERPCIFIANHQSILDVAVLGWLHPADAVAIAKKELKRIPFFGWLYAVTGNIYIDREDHTSAVAALRATAEEVVRRRAAVWIFPEGTRGDVPGELLPFKKGAFQMAIASGLPLVPVVVAPLKPEFDLGARRLTPGTVEVRVLEPILTAGLGEDDVPALMHEARARMEHALHELARGKEGGRR